MTPLEVLENIEEILNSTINNDESLDYELTSFDLYWLEIAKAALEKQMPKKPLVICRKIIKPQLQKLQI